MSVHPYKLRNGAIRWQYVIDLPPGADGKRRQKRGLLLEADAEVVGSQGHPYAWIGNAAEIKKLRRENAELERANRRCAGPL